MLKYGTVGIERCDFLHHQELDVAQRGFLHVHDVYLYALQQFTLTHGVEGFQIHRPEYNTRHIQCVQVSRQFFCFYPLCGEHLERYRIAYPDGHISQFTQNTAYRIEYSRVRMGNMRRRGYPLQPCLYIVHLAFPAFHLHNVQVTLCCHHLLSVQHQCQLTASQPVKVRNLELTDKRNAIIFYQIAFYLESAYRVGAIQYNKFFTVFGCCFHSQSHCTDIGE